MKDHKLVPLRPPESILAVVRKAYGNATAYDVGHVWHEIYTRLPDAAPVQEQQPAPASKPVLLQCLGCERVGTQEQLSASTDCDCWLHTQPAPVERTVRGASKKLWLQQGVFPDLADFDANGLPRFYSQESATKFQGGQLSKPCTGKNCGSMSGWMHSIECIAEHEAVITATHSESAPVQEPVAYHTDGVMREVFAQCLTSTYVCSRVWAAWGVGTMSEDDFSPASECDELLDELVQAHKTINALDAKLAQPRKAVKLSDYDVGRLTVFDGLHHAETPLLAEFIRAIEQAVWAKLGVTE